MRGLTHELMYPSQVVTMKAVSPGHQPSSNLMQMALIILQVKKGTQHTKNTPVEWRKKMHQKEKVNLLVKKMDEKKE